MKQQACLTTASLLGLQQAATLQGYSWLFLSRFGDYTPGLLSDQKMPMMDRIHSFRNQRMNNNLRWVAQPALAELQNKKKLMFEC